MIFEEAFGKISDDTGVNLLLINREKDTSKFILIPLLLDNFYLTISTNLQNDELNKSQDYCNYFFNRKEFNTVYQNKTIRYPMCSIETWWVKRLILNNAKDMTQFY